MKTLIYEPLLWLEILFLSHNFASSTSPIQLTLYYMNIFKMRTLLGLYRVSKKKSDKNKS